MPTYDAVVVGLGAMGSAALYHLARRRLRVLGIEQFAPGHDRGSSHGATRVIRLAYFEHPSYVPLLRRAYALWRELEAESGQSLLHITGIAEMGPPDGMLVQGTLAAAQQHRLPHEFVAAAELMHRHPAFRLPEHYVAVLQPDGGFVAAEPAIAAHVALARQAGAEIRTGATVRAILPAAGAARLRTDRETIDAGAAIVCAGPWLPRLLPDLRLPLRVTRNVLGWFVPAGPDLVADGGLPVFLLESRHGIHYGFPPDAGGRVKVAKHHHDDQAVDPEDVDRTVSAADERLIRAALADHLPAVNGPLREATTCLYTKTPDGDFVIDRLPQAPQIVVASPCSGHGFKFSPLIGEVLADLAIAGSTAHDIRRFSLGRFA
jgi:sarcosine oxidase